MRNQTWRLKGPARQFASVFLLATILSISSACSSKREPVQIQFAATWQNHAIDCDSDQTAISDLRFYVSDVVLLDASGAEHNLSMTEDGRWQLPDIALIDLENGEGGCVNGTSATNPALQGTADIADIADIAGVRFTVGVPFDLNHANPLLASPPLDSAAMHWHWRSGYKFIRAGVRNEKDGFWLHLGSTACEGTVQNVSFCRNPNRVEVEINGFSPASDVIAVDLSNLFRGVNITDGNLSNCSSSPAESSCEDPFSALGLPANEKSSQVQNVFRVLH
jgi:uncharacterized repeat protein (TIGR04052 family)